MDGELIVEAQDYANEFYNWEVLAHKGRRALFPDKVPHTLHRLSQRRFRTGGPGDHLTFTTIFYAFRASQADPGHQPGKISGEQFPEPNNDIQIYTTPRWKNHLESTPAFKNGEYVMSGTDDGVIELKHATRTLWRKQTAFEFAVDSSFDVWTLHRPTITAVAIALQSKLALYCPGDGHLYAADLETGQHRWRWQIQWGNTVTIRAADLNGDGEEEILVGTAKPSIHSQVWILSHTGEKLQVLKRPADADWNLATACTALEIADIDGDGRPEILHGTANSTRQFAVWRWPNQLLWDAEVGDDVEKIEFLDKKVSVTTASGLVWSFTGEGTLLDKRKAI